MRKGLYKYINKFYVVIGKTKTRNSVNGEWEKHIIYTSILSGEWCSVEEKFFDKYFVRVDGGELC